MPKRYTNACSARGAQMGRATTIAPRDTKVKLHLERVRLTQQGYDPGGAYWGNCEPLYTFYDDDCTVDDYTRARGREQAKNIIMQKYPNARFYR